MSTPRSTAPATPVLAVSCRMLRSPSHESVTTDLSLFSVSSLASDALGGKHRIFTLKERGPSPNPEVKLQLTRPANIPEITWFEEGNDLIRSCAALSSALGIQKSFSTSDITQLSYPDAQPNQLRPTVSELALNSLQRCGYMLENPRLDHTSRSCSTWVAVGELATTSQLPSPHGGSINPTITNEPAVPPSFTAADLIRSVNKKVRQTYIRKRLLTTYRALERLSQSEFNLDRLEAAALAASAQSGNLGGSGCTGPGPTELLVPNIVKTKPNDGAKTIDKKISKPDKDIKIEEKLAKATQNKQIICEELKKKLSLNQNLTMHDIERERGKPLSKYDRNILIFNWLHSLDENSTVEDMP